MKYKILLIFGAFSLASTAFAQSNKTLGQDIMQNSKSTTVEAQKDNQSIDFTNPDRPVAVEKTMPRFVIRLPSNITTGYSWFLQSPIDPNIIPSKHLYYRPKDLKELRPGASGYEEWVFEIAPEGFLVPQTTILTFVYSRPWELQEAKRVQIRVYTH